VKVKGQRAEGKGRARRAALAALMITLLVPAVAGAQQMVIFVRHAERADGGPAPGTMTGAPADPLLSPAGQARAARLAVMLADAGIKAIFATEFHRTQDTGKPLAAKLGIEVQAIPGNDAAGLVAKVKASNPKDVVLVIGHSNTVPAAIKALGGPVVTMRDDEYDAIYLLNPATGAWTLIRY
jgi:broad specificity phosphatase PhoE